jgi:GT2 family glycosyltransferase
MKTQQSANTAKATVDFICPTWNNETILNRFVMSLVRFTAEPFRLVIVNNGDKPIYFTHQDPRVIVLTAGKNLGWMGGINAGLEWVRANDPAKYICFINDDVQVLEHDYGWLPKMLKAFEKPGVGAVGPTSNAIMGYQSFHHVGLPPYLETAALSGMCMLVKREVIEKIGGLDENLPGGDDLDYSIRIRDAGYRLGICRRTFLFHHYGQTGKRVHGEYWDSQAHSEAINAALIKKHGFKAWYTTANNMLPGGGGYDFVASEEKLALEELAPHLDGKVLDLGCGGKKIDPRVIGVDIRPNGDYGVGYNALIPSGGEVACDVVELKPFADKSVDAILAKHLFEHLINPVKALKEWGRVLKDGGRLVIIVPDWRYCEAISCDPSHTAAYTPESLTSLIEACGGFKVTRTENVDPGYVTMVSCEKITMLDSRHGDKSYENEPGHSRGICSCHPMAVPA